MTDMKVMHSFPHGKSSSVYKSRLAKSNLYKYFPSIFFSKHTRESNSLDYDEALSYSNSRCDPNCLDYLKMIDPIAYAKNVQTNNF